MVAAILAAGCGQGATATPVPTSTPTPTIAPTPTQESAAVAGPSDPYFDLDRVMDIEIEIAPEDWDTLRHQTRTFDDVMAEIERYGLSRPFADIYTWFSGDVTVDGETYTNVGVRKKGFLGSQSDTKPALKLRFDKYVDGQSLGGVMERMTLNNSIQDPSMVNTCLTLQIFAAAGSPSPRCNFATVTVNGTPLGLYVHVEEIKKPFLARHFDSAEGNLYEGTVSDFTPEFRGTIEKKANEDEDDWSDIDSVVDALQDPSDAGIEALGKVVDLDRFLSFWATEVLVGHWDGYAGNRNNYQFYREPDGPFVFIPWGVDGTFHLEDDPNPFDNISNPPPSVLALTAISNRLYNNPDWRTKYAVRLKGLLDTVWNEDELLASVDRMAAIVQRYSLPEVREAAAEDTGRVRKFILKRRGEILADITPEPPDWPEPDEAVAAGPSGALELSFETTWGSNKSANVLEEGTVTRLLLNGNEESVQGVAVIAGHASQDEQAILPGVGELASIAVISVEPDGSANGLTIVMPLSLLTGGATLAIGQDEIAGGVWTIPAGAATPDSFTPFTSGALELSEGGTGPRAAIAGSFSGVFGSQPGLEPGEEISARDSIWAAAALGDVAEMEDHLAAGASLDVYDPVFGVTPLSWAALYGRDKAAAWLLDAGAEVNARNQDGGTALHSAAFMGRAEIVRLLLERRADANVVDENGARPLDVSFVDAETTAWVAGLLGVSYDQSALDKGRKEAARFLGVAADAGLVINEVAAKGGPLDWFELYNASDEEIALADFVVADDLEDAAKRVAFPAGLAIPPGGYLQMELDKGGWPGFALGGDEELGIWTLDGLLVAEVDWEEGQAGGEGMSFARTPDVVGEFQTVGNPTPGSANQTGD